MELFGGHLWGQGGIGIMYHSTFWGVVTYLILAIVICLALVGLATITKWWFGWKHSKKKDKTDPGKEWLKTGKT